MIFKAVGDRRPYSDQVLQGIPWTAIPPRTVRLDQLTTTRAQLDLNTLLSEDSTFYGDLFAHVVAWRGELYLEDGLHRALRSALHGRSVIHVRILELGDDGTPLAPDGTVIR
nr:type II toxin-antitoxin system VapB family antitoxin [Actinomycetales bacterium]